MASASQRTRGAAVADFLAELNRAIDSKRITVAKLAELTNISRMQIYRLIRGENEPTLKTAELIAKHIGLKISIEKKK